jgi:maltokinase
MGDVVGLAGLLAAGPVPGASSHLVDLVSRSASGGRVRDGDCALVVLGDPGVVAGAERPIPVDQTNVSVVVGEAVRVKWLRPGGAGPGRGAGAARAVVLTRHLRHVGFTAMPRPLAVAVREANGEQVPVAFVEGFLPGAVDGWEWCPDLAGAGDLTFARRLGELAADLHVALATPSPLVPNPLSSATAARVAQWREAALACVDSALDAADRLQGVAPMVGPRAGLLRDAVGALADPRLAGTAVQPVHGDLHVGQVLRWDGGLAVVDLDGNPVVDDPAAPQPAARDLAQLLTSLDHVARVTEKRAGRPGSGHLAGWAADAREACLDAYTDRLAGAGRAHLLDERLLAPFMAEQECREIVYAGRHLPRWAYAPATTLRVWWPEVAGRDRERG